MHAKYAPLLLEKLGFTMNTYQIVYVKQQNL